VFLTVVGAVLLLLVVFVAYYCGGYVAGRMARFDGVKQGLAVWLWSLAVAVVVAVVGALLGDRFQAALADLNAFPRFSPDAMGTTGIIAALVVLVASLGGAVLGGSVGMRYHRRGELTGPSRWTPLTGAAPVAAWRTTIAAPARWALAVTARAGKTGQVRESTAPGVEGPMADRATEDAWTSTR
ncbi:MAG TPA: hypothetical protein PKB06_00720, partial [Actinotalea sp.]|nr:hypothetical protein [Actinotalea sp.]